MTDDAARARDLAIKIVDGVRGYTCEFGPNPREHSSWYDFIAEELTKFESAAEARGREASGLIEENARLASLAKTHGDNWNRAQETCATLRERAAELEAALRGVVAVADRETDEFDRARAALSRRVPS